MWKNNVNEIKKDINDITTNLLEVKFKKYFIRWIIVLIVIFLWYILYPFFNVPVWKIWIVENFFTKKISVEKTWLNIINPFSIKILYDNNYQIIDFNWIKKEENKNIWLYDNLKSKTDYSNLPLANVITKDWNNLDLNLTLIFKIKETEIINIYTKSRDKYIDLLVLPAISKWLSNVFGSKDFYSVVSDDKWTNLSEELKKSISEELEKNWFEMITLSFKKIVPSAELAKRIESIFDSQKELKLIELWKQKTLLQLEIQELDNNSKIELLTKLKQKWISIDEYTKLKTINTFEEKWNWNIIPEWLLNIINNK